MAALPGKPSILAKPTLDTRFHIDYDWWKRTEGEDLRIYLISHLPPDERAHFSQQGEDAHMVDFVDPASGEVFKLDPLGQALKRAAASPDFLIDVSTVDAIFRVFIRNNNTPATVREIAQQIDYDEKRLLDLLRKQRYKGISPILES
ncbi:MAG TPA: hypothetical protein PKX07_00510 [Aggregatilineales bacterium]|jgi:hypothetical protein|nr:hypothetical protein [Aggregatilineales bacterium]